MSRAVRLGWYIHHHGSGHLTRALAIAPHLHADVRYFSSLPAPTALPAAATWTRLPRDDDPAPDGADPALADPTAGGLLHWAPLGHAGHTRRLATIAQSLTNEPVDAFVVDVSVEVTLLVRLLGARPVVIAQPGTRTDEPHRLAYASAAAVLAPWPGRLLSPAHLNAVRDRVVYTGGISRFDGRADTAESGSGNGSGDDVLVLGGRGGTAVTGADVARAGEATGRRWEVLGGGSSWADDPWQRLRSARVVVSWAGQNAVADLAAAGVRAVVVPQDRPFDEQRETAATLDRAGLAVVVPKWPDARDWPDVLRRADTLEPDWTPWRVSGAAERAARAIEATAAAAL